MYIYGPPSQYENRDLNAGYAFRRDRNCERRVSNAVAALRIEEIEAKKNPPTSRKRLTSEVIQDIGQTEGSTKPISKCPKWVKGIANYFRKHLKK